MTGAADFVSAASRIVDLARMARRPGAGRPTRLLDADVLAAFFAAGARGYARSRAVTVAGLSEAAVRRWLSDAAEPRAACEAFAETLSTVEALPPPCQ